MRSKAPSRLGSWTETVVYGLDQSNTSNAADDDFDADLDWIDTYEPWEMLTRDPETGEITRALKLKRKTDDASVALVEAFLDCVEIELVLPSGRALIIFITAYSQNDDGTEEFTVRQVEEKNLPAPTDPPNLADGNAHSRSIEIPAEYITRTYKK